MKARYLFTLLVALLAGLSVASTSIASTDSAPRPSITITSPAEGAKVYGSSVTVRVTISNFRLIQPVLLAPAKWGTIPLLPGNEGHIHYVLDTLSNLVLTRDVVTQTSHTWTGVPPGKHTLIAYLATSQHAQFPGTRVAMVHVTVAAPRAPAVTQRTIAPSIRISGANTQVERSGMTVAVKVAVSHFTLVKPILRPPSRWSTIPLLPGNQGHIHYVLDNISNLRLTRDVVPDLVHNWTNVSPGWHTITAYLATSQHQQFPGTQPSSTRIFVPATQKAVRVRSLPITGGAVAEDLSRQLVMGIVGVVAILLGLAACAHSSIRFRVTPSAKS